MGVQRQEYPVESQIMAAIVSEGVVPSVNEKSYSYSIERKKHPELYMFLLEQLKQIDFTQSGGRIIQISIVWMNQKIIIFAKKE